MPNKRTTSYDYDTKGKDTLIVYPGDPKKEPVEVKVEPSYIEDVKKAPPLTQNRMLKAQYDIATAKD